MSEIQARWLVYLIKNKIKLPSEKEMAQQIIQHRVNFLFDKALKIKKKTKLRIFIKKIENRKSLKNDSRKV